jgi:branched-chain amino acid transport system substrate-binding protein
MAAASTALAQAPIKVGFLVPLAGPFAQIGKDMVAGTELYLEEIQYTAGGRKIQMIIEDTAGNPQTALTRARKLLEQDNVHLLTGGLLSSTAYALQPYVDSRQIPTAYPVAAPDDITQRKPAKWIVRTGWATSQPMHPFGEWVAKNLKYKRIAIIAMDDSFGWETAEGFQQSFEDSGGQIVQKLWVPFNTNDFAPYLPRIRRDADTVFALFVGNLALQFVKQYETSDLKGRIPLIAGGTTTDESVLGSMGDEAIGIVTS